MSTILGPILALLQSLLAMIGIPIATTTYSDRIASSGHTVLASSAQVRDGDGRFECLGSDSGWCHYTLYPRQCLDDGCRAAPLRRFAVPRGNVRRVDGLPAFHLCVSTDAAAIGPDCRPATTPRDTPR